MVRRKDVPVLLTVAAVGLGVGVGMWLMRDKLTAAAKAVGPAARRLADNPLDVFGTDVPDDDTGSAVGRRFSSGIRTFACGSASAPGNQAASAWGLAPAVDGTSMRW